MKTLAILNRENVSESEIQRLRIRLATRGIIFDKNNNIALLHQLSEDWYGLPGGGVEDGEDFEQGLIRECKEEIGCTIEIRSLLGKTIEIRKQDNFISENHGYIVSIVGEKGNPDKEDYTSYSAIVWVPLKEAIHLIESTSDQESLHGNRDVVFLKEAEDILSTSI